MTLVSIAPGSPCAVRAYLCAPGSKLKIRAADIKVNDTPTAQEVEAIRKEPVQFVAALSFEDGAA